MFNFTTTLSYGLRLLLNLHFTGSSPKQLKRIAQEENISLSYLRKLIPPLEKADIIKSLKGPGGGFLLKRKPDQVSLLEIVNIFSRSKVIDCIKGPSDCRRYANCAVKDLLEEIYNKAQLVLENKTLATLIKK